MSKDAEKMSGKKLHARLMVDQKALCILGRMADLEGRDRQRNLGIILERVADAFDKDPLKLVPLGIITDHVAAVA